MEAPKCRICGHNHWSNEDHVQAKGDDLLVKMVKSARETKSMVLEKIKFDRTAYQREYMRKRRKKHAGD